MPDVLSPSEPASISKVRINKNGALGIAIVFMLAVAGAFVWWDAEPSTSAAESTLVLETFVVNLTGSSQRAYLRIGITLGLAHPLASRNPEAVPTALVRDTILGILATAQPEQMLKAEGKQRLKEELLKALQDRAPQIAVTNVYFTEFLVQM
jgi:flagellar basal body-associated protein FliL